MTERELVCALHEIARREVPDDVNLWPAIRARVEPIRRPVLVARLRPATRLGWAGLALVLLLVVGTVGYALAPVVGRLFEQETGLSRVQQAGLSQEIDLRQTVDGVTVILERGYADANRIVLGYTIQSSDGRRYDPASMVLSGSSGTVFTPTVGMGAIGQDDVLEISLPPGEGGYIFSFDATGLPEAPSTLDLNLEVELREFIVPANTPGQPVAQDKAAAQPAGAAVAEAGPARSGAVVGPFVFDFRLPFLPGYTVDVGQTATAAGVTLELKRVVVTPSETRALLCIEAPGDGWESWAVVATLGTEEGEAHSAWSATRQDQCSLHGFLPPLAGQHGDWKLVVTELIEFAGIESGGGNTRLSGPWVFYFRVP